MSKRKVYTGDFSEGLNTTGKEDGLRIRRWPVFANIRLNEGPAQRRKGIQFIDQCSDPSTALDFQDTGSTDHVAVPKVADIHTLKKRWTCVYLVNPDGVSGTQTIHGFNHATDWPINVYLDDDTLTAKVTDSAGTVVTLTHTVTAIKLVISVIRDGTSLSLWVNGAEVDTDTMADLDCKEPGGDMYFGRDASGDYFDGLFDNAHAFSVALTNQREAQMRLVDPRVDSVLWDYPMEIADTTTRRVDDRSLNGVHGQYVGVVVTGTAQSFQVTPVNAIHDWTDNKNRQRLAVLAGAEMFLGEVRL